MVTGVQGGRYVRRLAATLALGLLVPASASSYTLVMSTGARVELVAEPQFVLGRARVVTVDGRSLVIPWSAVSWSSTEQVNRAAASATAAPRPAAGRVWTNADLERLRGGPLNIAAGASSTEPAAASPGAEPEAGAKPDEGEWRARAGQIAEDQARMEARAAELDALDRQWEALVIATGGGYASAAARSLSDIRAERSRLDAELQQVRGERSRLEDEARRSGIPPGWLR